MAVRGWPWWTGCVSCSRVSSAPLHPRPLDLAAIAPRLLEQARAFAPDAVVTPHVTPGPAVLGDPALVPLMLAQLFTNAVRFSERPVRQVWFGPAAARDVDVPEGHEVYAVRDDGIGIPAKFHTPSSTCSSAHGVDHFGGGIGAGRAGQPDRGASWRPLWVDLRAR
jgi:light-regulated signal transduction histidine kinase (bacteriophytochrome)